MEKRTLIIERIFLGMKIDLYISRFPWDLSHKKLEDELLKCLIASWVDLN